MTHLMDSFEEQLGIAEAESRSLIQAMSKEWDQYQSRTHFAIAFGQRPADAWTFVPAPGHAVEIRVELGVSVIELVVVLLFAAFYLLGALTPGYLASDLILGAMFLAWVGFFVLVLARWNRGADRLVQILADTCEAAARQE
jgi:hypothetical protein